MKITGTKIAQNVDTTPILRFFLLLSLVDISTGGIDRVDLLCLTPLSAIFQLYHGDQF
jgi:hypothetical protein